MKKLDRYIPLFEKTTNPQTKTPQFKKWFGKSKVVDKSGNPLVVYHGTNKSFKSFDLSKSGGNYNYGKGGIFFTDRERSAKNYAKLHLDRDRGVGKENVLSVYLTIQNPYREMAIDYWDAVDKFDRNSWMLKDAQREGHDGIIIESPSGSMYIAFQPNQIKSATGNNGDFDPRSDNILEAVSLTESSNQKVILKEALSLMVIIGLILSMPRLVQSIAKTFNFIYKKIKKLFKKGDQDSDLLKKVIEFTDKWHHFYIKILHKALKLAGIFKAAKIDDPKTQKKVTEAIYYTLIFGLAISSGIGTVEQILHVLKDASLSNVGFSTLETALTAVKSREVQEFLLNLKS